MRRTHVAVIAAATLALLALTGCAPDAPTADPTKKYREVTEAAVSEGHVKVNGTNYAPPSGWSVRCNLGVDEPWVLASSKNAKEPYPTLTAGHGQPGDRSLLLIVKEGEQWFGYEAEGLEYELDEDGLRASGEVVSGTDYSVKATLDIDLPCGTIY